MSDAPGRYRKVYPRIWRHPGFRGLSPSARELTLYLLTGPQTNRIGLFHFSVATAAEDLGVSVETCRTRLRDVSATCGWLYDADARVVYIPSWWKWNRPENPDVLRGNLKDLNEVPPCGLGEAFAQNLQFLPDTWHQTFIETCRTRLATRVPHQEQEQDQDQDQDQKQEQEHRGPVRAPAFGRKRAPEERKDGSNEEQLLPVAREVLNLTNPAASIDHLVDTFLSYKPNACTKAQATKALNVALSERRRAANA